MYYKAFLAILLLFNCVTGFSQYSCTVTSNCDNGDGLRDSAILFIRYYNAKNLLVKEVTNESIDDFQESYISTYTYTPEGLLKVAVDSNQFRKVTKEYSYKGGKISKVLQINFTLSTENFNYRERLGPDSINQNRQPDIRYVWLIDTIIQDYRYNAKGLLIKINKKSTNDFYERTETFEYDEKDRLIRSTVSDQFQYKYYYDEYSRVVKKEKYRNSYIDDSSIGPDLKPESARLKKAVWSIASTNKMKYDAVGRLTQNTEYTGNDSFGYHTENHFYDQQGRIYQTTSETVYGDAYFPLCRTDYTYE